MSTHYNALLYTLSLVFRVLEEYTLQCHCYTLIVGSHDRRSLQLSPKMYYYT